MTTTPTTKMLRRAAMPLVLGALAIGMLAVPAGAGDPTVNTLTVRKVVTGDAAAGTTVTVSCSYDDDGVVEVTKTLGFDATGAPTDATGDDLLGAWEKVDGAWVAVGSPLNNLTTCTFTETETGGAVSTSWTCDYSVQAKEISTDWGCDAASGADVGPATVVLGEFPGVGFSDTQTATVVFTNTHAETPPAPPAPPVELAPSFTG